MPDLCKPSARAALLLLLKDVKRGSWLSGKSPEFYKGGRGVLSDFQIFFSKLFIPKDLGPKWGIDHPALFAMIQITPSKLLILKGHQKTAQIIFSLPVPPYTGDC